MNKFSIQSDSNKLTYDTIYLNVCAKYKDMNVMASRTLIVNPQDDQKNAYLIANDALDLCIKSLVVGQPIKNACLKTKEFIASKDASLANKVHTNFGFGVSHISIDLFLDWSSIQGGYPSDQRQQ
jgi:nucleosome binding factor SPN SPT16 subunit